MFLYNIEWIKTVNACRIIAFTVHVLHTRKSIGIYTVMLLRYTIIISIRSLRRKVIIYLKFKYI